MKDILIERGMFFSDRALDDDLPMVNEAFWSALIGHIERDRDLSPRIILDVGCHTGGLLDALRRKFAPAELFGIEPLVTSPSFCTSTNERVYITARACEPAFGAARDLQAAGAGGL